MAFLSRSQRRLARRGAPVFAYHKIGLPPKTSCDPFLYTRPAEFDRQLTLARNAGFRIAGLDEALPFSSGTDRKATVTFDDGFQNVFENGLETLRRHKVNAIQFLVADMIGKQNGWDIEKGDLPEPLMDAAQIKEWLAAGHEIGSHSATHRNLKKLSAAEAREEISGSKKFLEDRFCVEVRHFCYPFGGWTPRVRDLVEEAGYHTACTTIFGVNGADTDRFALRRIVPLSKADLLRKVWHRLGRKIVGHT